MINYKKLRVVVVDDDAEVLKTLVKIISRRGCAVFAFPSAELALDFLKKEPADLIFSDLKMPGMDGIQFLAAAKKSRPAAPFILVTGFASIDTAVSAIQWGAFDYLRKPFEVKKIYEVMDNALSMGGGAS